VMTRVGGAISLAILDVHKSFGETHALAGVSFDISQGETVAVLGPSGCGKSTLLNLIAGLELPDQGDILWNDVSLANTPPYKRGFGLMFQDFALFPHKNVFENVAFGLQMAGLSRLEIQARVGETLELVGLPGFVERDVNTLSGGEQQRVALARSLAPHPRLLMLDEPLGSLDRNLRERLALDLHEILQRTRQTALYVTHDQEEAFVLANRVVVMNAGRVEQIGAPQTIYRRPASAFVARFLGLTNLIPGEVRPGSHGNEILTSIGNLPAPGLAQGAATVLIRPDAAHLDGNNGFELDARLARVDFRGSICRVTFAVNDLSLTFDFPSSVDLPDIGETASLRISIPGGIQIFPADI
jgi:ABC-type Fe3+/spermidine/putrescine transport system ATPase subunit